ncbi:MAG: hypothetical protein LH645_11210 [Actinomycetia bacterium]|nr:hypothetical protein [Actinomycetes bacterium]
MRRTHTHAGSVALTAVIVAASALIGMGSANAEDVPYEDPAAIGSMTLCDTDLQPVTEGSLTDRPFVWRAVSDTSAPAPYDDKNRRAVLYYYQPRENVDPGEWSYEILTAASTYSDPRYPIAQATPIDFPLLSAATNYPPQWDGFVQLRVYFTTDGLPQSPDYVSADIRIQGDNWTLVRGGDAPCDAGKAVSPELALSDYEKRVRQAQNGTDNLSKEFGLTPSDEGSGATPDPSSSAKNPAAGNDSDQSPAAADTAASSVAPSGNSSVLWGALIVAVVVMAGISGLVAWINRR